MRSVFTQGKETGSFALIQNSTILTALILATLLWGDVSAQSTLTEQPVRGAASITKRFVTIENLRAHYLETEVDEQ
jgi:hypothetical protein